MTRIPLKIVAGALAVGAGALGAAAIASGSGSTSTTSTTTTSAAAARPARTPETALAGDTLAKVTAAAIAKTGGTVDAATTENDSSDPAAVYEAHVTKADGSHMTVILDKDYNVLSVETGHAGGHHGHGGGTGETPLTGDLAAKAKAAAVAQTGGTADEATTETDSSNAAAAYEVHVTKADGSHVTVILDKDYNVLGVETQEVHGGHAH
jgi:uncharacterized membrane protein YkoI